MFFQYGERRINTLSIRYYQPKESDIIIIYTDGTKEELHFFSNKKEMYELIKLLDQNLLLNK
jgi:hypothetical protein